jgi:hypothetical protein
MKTAPVISRPFVVSRYICTVYSCLIWAFNQINLELRLNSKLRTYTLEWILLHVRFHYPYYSVYVRFTGTTRYEMSYLFCCVCCTRNRQDCVCIRNSSAKVLEEHWWNMALN